MTDDAYDQTDELPPHDWLLVPLIPITAREAQRLEEGTRVVFKKLDIQDPSQVRGAAVYCARCQIPLEKLGAGERDVCRGELSDDVSPEATR